MFCKVAWLKAARQTVLFCDIFKGKVQLNLYFKRLKSTALASTDGKTRFVRLLKNAGRLKPSGLNLN